MRSFYPSPAQNDAKLAPRHAELLTFIRARVSATGEWPTKSEMADAMGWQSEGSVNDCLGRLEWRGYINKIGPGRWRLR